MYYLIMVDGFKVGVKFLTNKDVKNLSKNPNIFVKPLKKGVKI